MSEIVLCEITDGVALLTLNRPDRLNAWTPALQTRYFDLLDECVARDDVRVDRGHRRRPRVLRRRRHGRPEDDLGGGRRSIARRAEDTRPVAYPLSMPKPVIAAINGPCAGIGLVLARDVRPAVRRRRAPRSPPRSPAAAWSPSTGSRGCCRGWSALPARSTCCSPGA